MFIHCLIIEVHMQYLFIYNKFSSVVKSNLDQRWKLPQPPSLNAWIQSLLQECLLDFAHYIIFNDY